MVMPRFILHVDDMMTKWFAEAWKQELANEKNVIASMKEKGLVSEYPNDIYTFLNQQIDLLSARIKGNSFIEILRLTFHNLSQVFVNVLNSVQNIKESENYLTVFLRLNNMLVCHNSFLVFREKCINVTAPECREMAENIITELYKSIFLRFKTGEKEVLESIEGIVEILCKVILKDIEKEIVLHMFTYF